MVLKSLAAAADALLAPSYRLHAVSLVVAVVVAYALAQGRATTRDCDLHARTVLVTGAFTPLGLTLVQNLAQRGAHAVALSPKPIDHPEVEILVQLLRSSTHNEHVYAEECDLSSSASARSWPRTTPVELAERRRAASLATFLMITLLLPVLLVAPVERNIRIVSVVNPFYVAASRTYSLTEPLPPATPLFKQEGRRSLETIVFIRHLQCVLDALPSGGQVPKTDEVTVRVVSGRVQKSNVVTVSVCPGVSRTDAVAALLKANSDQARRSVLGTVVYFVSQPLLRLWTKPQTSAVQSILHVLFLQTPFKNAGASPATFTEDNPEEVLKAGALYRECAVVHVRIPTPDSNPSGSEETKGEAMPDDRELGGVHLGQSVWESFEVVLKEWERTSPPSGGDTPSVDTPASS